MPSKWNSWNEELKRSAVIVAIMQQKNVIQPSFRLQNDDTSSMANSRPPTGAAKAADTPAAAPAVVKLRLQTHVRSFACIHPTASRNKNVNNRKQIARQHSCHKKIVDRAVGGVDPCKILL